MIFPRRIASYFVGTWLRLGLLVLCFILALSFVVIFSDQMRDLSHAEVSWQVGMWLILHQVPNLIAMILPISIFISQVLGLNHFYQSREILAFYACGGSRFQIMLIMMGYGVLMAVILSAISGWWVPHMSKLSRELLKVASHQVSDDVWSIRTFHKMGKRWTAYLDWEASQKQKRFFLVHANQDGTEDVIIMRDIAIHKLSTEDNKRNVDAGMVLRYHGTPGERDFTVARTRGGRWSLVPKDKILAKKDKAPVNNWHVLWQKRSDSMAAWHKWQGVIAQPIAMIISSLLAVVLVHMRLRNVQWLQIIMPLACYMVYQGSLFVAQSTSFVGWGSLGLWWVHLAVLALIFVQSIRGWYRHEH